MKKTQEHKCYECGWIGANPESCGLCGPGTKCSCPVCKHCGTVIPMGKEMPPMRDERARGDEKQEKNDYKEWAEKVLGKEGGR